MTTFKRNRVIQQIVKKQKIDARTKC
jgi:hypothetical protein